MSTTHRLARLVFLTLAYAAVSLIDRALFLAELERVNRETADLDEDQADDDLEPFDASDVVEAHRRCCTGQAA